MDHLEKHNMMAALFISRMVRRRCISAHVIVAGDRPQLRHKEHDAFEDYVDHISPIIERSERAILRKERADARKANHD